MYHIGLLLIFVLIRLTPDTNISNVPLAQLTLAMIGDKVFFYGMVFGALWLLYRSLEHDKIWPWKWDKYFLADWMAAIVVWCLLLWLGAGAKKNEETVMLVCFVLGAIGYAFVLEKAYVQDQARLQVLSQMTFDRSRFTEGFDDHAARTCIAIYVEETLSKTGALPEGVCLVDTGRGWSFEVNFPKPKLLHVLRECVA